jgi:tetratricopeptide (TPR) repeat protein
MGDAEQVAAKTAQAQKLERQGKYEEARAIYQEVAATHPQGDEAAKARWAIAQSHKAEHKIGMAVPALELIVADRAGATPKLFGQALTMLANARFAMAADFAKAKKYDAAIAALRPMVDDERFTAAKVRSAMRQIVRYDLARGKPADAIATYRSLLSKPSVGEKERLEDMGALAELDPAEVAEFDKFIKAHPVSPPAILAQAHYEKGRIYLQLSQTDKAVAAFDAALAVKGVPFIWARLALVGKATAEVQNKDPTGAVAIYWSLLKQPPPKPPPKPKMAPNLAGGPPPKKVYIGRDRLSDLERLIATAPGLDVTPQVVTYLNYVENVQDVSLSSYAPKNDVLYAVQTGREGDGVRFKGTERYEEFLQETTGQAPKEKLDAVDVQLAFGGELRPFVTSPFSKEVAKRISPSAPLAEFLKPLLAGDYRAAARFAWRKARTAMFPKVRDNWINAVVLAIACEDQSRAGRATAFFNWVNPDSMSAKAVGAKADPLSDYLGLPELPYQVTRSKMAAAAADLNNRKNMNRLYKRIVARVLPENDVLLTATGDGPEKNYQRYLWRTTGRAPEALVAAVRARVVHGGDDKPFVVSEQSKKLAGMITDKAPMGDYLKLLFGGNHQAAARLAWKKSVAAKQSKGPAYAAWIDAVVTAVRCHNQMIGGRAADFADWTKGKLLGPDGLPVAANPLAAFLGD